MTIPTVEEVAANLILSVISEADRSLIQSKIEAAVAYAEGYQHLKAGYYTAEDATMTANTKNAIIMLASHYYESRDGSTGGFFADSVSAGKAAMETVDKLLQLDRDWAV